MLCAKNSGIGRGQTLRVARRICMAKSCFHVQENEFEERSTLFHHCFIANGFGQGWYMENVRLCLNNREICEIYFEGNFKNLKTCLISSGYPERMVKKTLWEVKYKDRNEALKQKTRINKKFLPLNVTFQSSSQKYEKHNHRQMANTERDIQRATLSLLDLL